MDKMENDYFSELEKARKKIREYKKPLILYDDDPDGLSSFLILYRWLREGRHHAIRSSPEVGTYYLDKIRDYNPDVIIILDKPLISERFIEGTNSPIIWFDHHTKDSYVCRRIWEINSRNFNLKNVSTAHIMYDMIKRDIWIGAVGAIGDWTLPRFIGDFKREFSDLLSGKERVEEILFSSKLGEIIKVFSFLLKLPTNKYKKSVEILLNLDNPYSLLEETSETYYIIKNIKPIYEEYNELMKKAGENINDDLILFIYDSGTSFTKELSNELLYLHNDKTIIVGRKKGDRIKCSIRSHVHILPAIVEKSLANIRGYGGGHEHACGASIHKDDFKVFVEQFKSELSKRSLH